MAAHIADKKIEARKARCIKAVADLDVDIADRTRALTWSGSCDAANGMAIIYAISVLQHMVSG